MAQIFTTTLLRSAVVVPVITPSPFRCSPGGRNDPLASLNVISEFPVAPLTDLAASAAWHGPDAAPAPRVAPLHNEKFTGCPFTGVGICETLSVRPFGPPAAGTAGAGT